MDAQELFAHDRLEECDYLFVDSPAHIKTNGIEKLPWRRARRTIAWAWSSTFSGRARSASIA